MARHLFDPVPLGNLTLANRFVRSATWEGMCEADGTPTPRLARLYRRLARGKVGLIISGYAFVRPDGKQLPGKMGIYSDTLIASLHELTRAVHEEGEHIFCQLVHAGGQTSAKVIGGTPLAPSAVPCANYPETPREMSAEDIQAIVEAFAQGARRAKEAGFDGVQLHGAHGYLINQFLSPLTNRRQDDYGGPLAKRMRFLEEVCRAVRRAVGSDYPVIIKLTASDNLPGGFDAGDAVDVAQRLEALSIDAIEVSSGTAASGEGNPVRQGIDGADKEAYNAVYAGRIRDAVGIPVMVVGGLRSGAVLQRLLREETADFFAFSRPLIRQPTLITGWQTDETLSATCISCNGCFRPGLKDGGIRCVLEPAEDDEQTPIA